jgi:hypothetical protein
LEGKPALTLPPRPSDEPYSKFAGLIAPVFKSFEYVFSTVKGDDLQFRTQHERKSGSCRSRGWRLKQQKSDLTPALGYCPPTAVTFVEPMMSLEDTGV